MRKAAGKLLSLSLWSIAASLLLIGIGHAANPDMLRPEEPWTAPVTNNSVPQIATTAPASVWYTRPVEPVAALPQDVLADDPGAVILSQNQASADGNRWEASVPAPGPEFAWLEQTTEWIEPVTPLDPTKRLKVAADKIAVAEVQGEAWVRAAEALDKGATVQVGAAFTSGQMLSTGVEGSVALLLGGICSVRLAPDSEAKVEMTLTGGKRTVRVELLKGIVFCKVGKRSGETEDFQVKTQLGTATSSGGDFAVVKSSESTHVWVAEGKVSVGQHGTSDVFEVFPKDGVPGVEHIPFGMHTAQIRAARQETLTTIVRLLPKLNQKLQTLRAGGMLTPDEDAYLRRLAKIRYWSRMQRNNSL